MKKKAIRLSIKKKLNDKDIEVTEMFEPYSLEVLQEISSLKEVINKDKNNYKSSKGLDADIYRDIESVIEVEDNEIINDVNDIYAPSEFDYFSDAIAVTALCRSKGQYSAGLQEIFESEMISQEFFFRAKVDLSMIINTDINKEGDDFKRFSKYCERRNLKSRLEEGIIANSDSNVYRYILRNIPMYRYLMSVKKLHKLPFTSKDMQEIAIYGDEKLDIKHNFSKDLIDKTKTMYETLKSELAQRYVIDNIGTKYTKKDGCFAIMEDTNGKKYFALSGNGDYKPDKKSYPQYKRVADKLAEALTGYRWANLTDDVLSYVDYDPNYGADIALQDPVSLKDCLKGMGDNWDLFKNKKGGYYSCCERKIFAHSNNNADKTFYVRWEPCEKCIPAMFQTSGTKTVHAFAKDFKSYKANKYKDNISIQVYHPSA